MAMTLVSYMVICIAIAGSVMGCGETETVGDPLWEKVEPTEMNGAGLEMTASVISPNDGAISDNNNDNAIRLEEDEKESDPIAGIMPDCKEADAVLDVAKAFGGYAASDFYPQETEFGMLYSAMGVPYEYQVLFRENRFVQFYAGYTVGDVTEGDPSETWLHAAPLAQKVCRSLFADADLTSALNLYQEAQLSGKNTLNGTSYVAELQNGMKIRYNVYMGRMDLTIETE